MMASDPALHRLDSALPSSHRTIQSLGAKVTRADAEVGGAGGIRTHTAADLNRVPPAVGLRPRGHRPGLTGPGTGQTPRSLRSLATWPAALTP